MLRSLRLKKASDDFSLNVFSLIFLFVADIFILVILFSALSEQVDQLTDEYEYFPWEYRSIYVDQKWVENNVVKNIATAVLREVRDTSDEKKYKKMHPVCQETEMRFEAMAKDKAIVALFTQRERLSNQYDNYDPYQKRQDSHAQGLLNKMDTLDQELKQMPIMQKMIDYIFDRQQVDFKRDIIRYKRVFALRRTAFGLMFLVPVLVVLFVWNRWAGRHDKNLSIIISSHLIIVSLIPILFELGRLLFEVIPKFLLRRIYDTLMSLNLISFWYYGVIALCVVLIAGIVWFLQTKVFTQKRSVMKSIQKSMCVRCGLKIDYTHEHCPNCSYQVLIPCGKCGAQTPKDLHYCQKCGSKLA